MTPTPLIFTYWKHLIESFCKVTWQICFWKLIDIDAEMYVCVCLCLCVGLSVGMRHWVWVCVCVCSCTMTTIQIPLYCFHLKTCRMFPSQRLSLHYYSLSLSLSFPPPLFLSFPKRNIGALIRHFISHSVISCHVNWTKHDRSRNEWSPFLERGSVQKGLMVSDKIFCFEQKEDSFFCVPIVTNTTNDPFDS